ncbi:MAG: hypothetical protein GY822_31170 [Deltaproteobacteria bacterium]|nr:hypothetical protein [Deltaproteobacteria bacterium]
MLTACPAPDENDAGIFVNDGGLDAGLVTVDGGNMDAGRVTMDDGGFDAGRDIVDDAGSESTDAGVGSAGFGFLSGACDVVATELSSSQPSLFVNFIDFGTDPYTEGADYSRLTEGGQEIIDDGNAGGSSVFSEVFSYEVLARCDDAILLKTETEVIHDVAGKITDLLVEIDGQKVGVSVTRAVGFPRDDPYTVDDATNLLVGKLDDVLESSANVSAEDAWVKQILHIIAYAPEHAVSIADAWALVDDNVRADTIVFITVSNGDDGFLY